MIFILTKRPAIHYYIIYMALGEMDMRIKRLLALLLTAAIVLTFASCATVTVTIPVNVGTAQSGAAPAGEPASTPAATEQAAAPTQQPAASTDTPATQAPASDDAAPAEASNGAPTTKAEIIKYYCDAYNKIATDAKEVTRTYDYTSNYNKILNINGNSTLESLAGTLMDKFMVETTDPLPGDASALPPVGLTTLNIPEDKISEATCVDKGSTYEITLKSTGTDDNQEADVNPGEGSAGLIGPLLRTDDVSGAVKGVLTFDGLHAYYATASVKATVDKASGHITELVYNTPCVLHFDQVTVVILKVKNCDIGLLFQQTWTATY